MEQLNLIKLKIDKIRSVISRAESDGMSSIDRDIMLSELRNIYSEILILNINDDSKPIEDKTTETHQKNTDNQADSSEQIKDEPKPNHHDKNALKNGEKVEVVKDQEKNVLKKSEPSLPKEKDAKEIKKVSDNQKPKKQSETIPSNDLFNGTAKNENDIKVLGEELGKNKKSLNELFSGGKSDISDRVNLSPLTDIKSGIGLGDRFLYIRELFNGDNELFENTIQKLNNMSSMDEAVTYLDSNFDWNGADSSVGSFLNVVKRKYI